MFSKQESKELTEQFWTQFGKRCSAHPLLKGRKKMWMLHKTKLRGFAFRFEANRENAKVVLELNHKNENKRLDAFVVLEQYKIVIEDEVPDELHWDFFHRREDNAKEICRVYAELQGVDIFRESQWATIYNFFIDNMCPLEQNFLLIRDALKAELN